MAGSSLPRIRLGVLGGSGLYEMPGLEEAREVDVATPYGPPSDSLIVGRLDGLPVAFLARHSRNHALLPTEIDYRANVFAMKALGADHLLSVSAVGSLQEEIHPLDLVVPDQFIDRTRHRADTFFGEGLVAHVSLADPVCTGLAHIADKEAREAGATVHSGGTYVCMEGPQFSTRAESDLYRSWGASVIGMTNLQEARLSREAEMCYSTLAFVTDYDCWKRDEEPVSVEAVVERLHKNADLGREVVRRVAAALPDSRDCPCHRSLDAALITPPDAIPPATRDRLGPILTRVVAARGG